MSFFDELTQKAKVVADTATEKAKEAADGAKTSVAIISEKRELDKSYRAIGQWYVNESREEAPPAIAGAVAAAKASLERIAALQAAREATETAGDRGGPGRACPVCGKIGDSMFCPYCGAPMDQ